jgi:hypothetical protein
MTTHTVDMGPKQANNREGMRMKATIEKIATNEYLVETDVFMSDLTYQSGVCELCGNTLKTKTGDGIVISPFCISLGEKSFAKITKMKIGDIEKF